jgi:hypothetical protein
MQRPLLLLLGLASTLQAQEPAVPPAADHLARVRSLLAEPQEREPSWRRMLFQSLRRLEFGPQELVRDGWKALDLPGDDAAHANLLVYLRRQGLPLPAPRVDEGQDSLLERALDAWGRLDLTATRRLLEEGARLHPEDGRFRNNLPWLPPGPLPSVEVPQDAGIRELAREVLALRRSRT